MPQRQTIEDDLNLHSTSKAGASDCSVDLTAWVITEGWREHYGRTCRLWTERLYANREAAYREAGTAKTKIWLMYLAACALAFERGTVGIFQTVATKKARGASGLPPTRRDLYA